MKKFFFILSISPFVFQNLYAQSNTFPSSGNAGIGTISPAAKLSFNNLNDGSNGADGITWFNLSPTDYGIHRTAGTWVYPNYQQLRLGWATGIILDPGASYNKSYVEIKGNGLRVTSGNTGIGTLTPAHKLDVEGDIRANSNYFIKSVGTGSGITAYDGWPAPGPGSTIFSITRQGTNNEIRFQAYGFHTFYSGGSTGTEKMRIDANGNILIGKTSQVNTAYKLDVNGPIRVSEVVVNTTGADFVFEESYALKKLEEVESFIKENKHLPEIEPAKEMQDNGLDLGKMNVKLL